MRDAPVVFSDDVISGDDSANEGGVWTLLVIDDDQDVHNVTEFVMHGVSILGRRLRFLHAYSAAEGRTILMNKQDIAVILLYVVMENETAGLTLVRTIREELGYTATRIILHTGQPGYAPEYEAIRDFDINDYRNKSELNYSRLLTSLTAAIRSYMQIRTVAEQNGGLEFIINSAPRLISQTPLEHFPGELVREVQDLLGQNIEAVLIEHRRRSGDGAAMRLIHATAAFAATVVSPAGISPELKLSNAELVPLLESGGSRFDRNWAGLCIAGLQDRDLCLYLETPHELTPAQRQILEVFTVMVSVGYQNILLVDRLRFLAFQDTTSGLLNRNGFIAAVDRARADAAKDMVVALVDIEGFSEINEVLGHDFGDELLLALGQRLQQVFPEPVVCARVSADGFALLGRQDLLTQDRISGVFSHPITVKQHSMFLRFVCGLVLAADVPGDGADLVKDAFIAVKIAKFQKKTRFYQYQPQFEEEARQKLGLLNELQKSLVNGGLEVHYQPQVDLGTGRLTGLEALIRWRRQDGNLVPPGMFIPLAEQSGLIVEIGDWVMEQACRQMLEWQALKVRELRMAVNISVRQFNNPDFLASLEAMFRRYALPPQTFELEITESMAMHDVETILYLLGRLKKMGFYLAIDDFGTGFSSLSYLQQLPIDRLKIDRSFVMSIHEAEQNKAIAQLIVGLGQSLGLSVIAEGVEVPEQSAILNQLGCGEAQGYFYGKPMIPADITAWLLKHHI
jgi:diguanylate cyclase (GGDEF)-like protein